MRNLLVFGASGQAKVVISIVEAAGTHRVAAVVVSDRSAEGEFLGFPLVAGEEKLARLVEEHETVEIVVAVGDNHARHLLRERIAAIVPDSRFPVIVHPAAQIARGAVIGQGSVVVACATVNADARIGEFSIIDAGANVGHDAVVGKFASLAPHASIGGWMTVGAFTAVGMGAVAIEKVRIGEHSVVGAGAVVVDDLPGHVVAVGNPAKAVRERRRGEPYYR